MLRDRLHHLSLGAIADVVEILFHDFVISYLSCPAQAPDISIDPFLLFFDILGSKDRIDRRFSHRYGLSNLNNEFVFEDSADMVVKVFPVLKTSLVSGVSLTVESGKISSV